MWRDEVGLKCAMCCYGVGGLDAGAWGVLYRAMFCGPRTQEIWEPLLLTNLFGLSILILFSVMLVSDIKGGT
jgi:hypothetical protein